MHRSERPELTAIGPNGRNKCKIENFEKGTRILIRQQKKSKISAHDPNSSGGQNLSRVQNLSLGEKKPTWQVVSSVPILTIILKLEFIETDNSDH
jgi:hypothetical protein